MQCALTDNIKMYEMAHVGCGANLALVDAGVAMLWVLDLQRPVLGVRVVDCPEALI